MVNTRNNWNNNSTSEARCLKTDDEKRKCSFEKKIRLVALDNRIRGSQTITRTSKNSQNKPSTDVERDKKGVRQNKVLSFGVQKFRQNHGGYRKLMPE